MIEIKVTLVEGGGGLHHKCNSFVDGDWVVFKCPLCPSYERRINPLTGEYQVTGLSTLVSHSGRNIPKWN